MESVRSVMGKLILAVSHPDMLPASAYDPKHSAKAGTWHIPPSQHGIDLVGFTLLYLPLFLAGWRAVGPTRCRIPPHRVSGRVRRVLWWVGVALLVILARTVFWKAEKGSLAFLLQPCHIFSATLAAVLLFPESRVGVVLFNMHVFLQWAPWMALFMPDMRSYVPWSLELISFFVQHVIITAVPLALIVAGTIPILSPRSSWFALGFGFWALYQVWVLGFGSLLTAVNLNYSLAPPPVLENSKTLHPIIQFYKWPVQLFTVPVSLFTGLLLPYILSPRSHPSSPTKKRQ